VGKVLTGLGAGSCAESPLRPLKSVAFEHVFVIDPLRDGQREIDIGRLAEDLLFYRKVSLHVGPTGLRELVQGVGAGALLELMARGSLKVIYADNVVVVQRQMDGVIAYYDPGVLTTARIAIEPKTNEVFNEFGGRKAGEYACRFLRLAEDRPHDVAVCDDTRALLEDAATVERLVRVLIDAKGGLPWGHPEPHFRPARHADGRFTLDTNIAFDSLERVAGTPMDASLLLSYLASYRSKLMLASEYGADVDTNDIDGALLAAHVEGLLQRQARSVSTETVLRLQEETLGVGNTVAEAIRSEERSFDDLLLVLDKAERFRDWFRDQEPGTELIDEYWRKATEDSWIQKLPAKTFRWMFATYLSAAVPGTAGIVAGAALGLFEMFILEKLVRGWRPNQFVESELKPFVRKRGP
jgi:hypothetical protein